MKKDRQSKAVAGHICKTATLFLFAATVIFSTEVKAQPPVKEKFEPATIAQKRTDELDRQLNLTEKQYKKVYRIILSQEKERFNNIPQFDGNMPGGMPGGPMGGGMPGGMHGGMPGGMPGGPMGGGMPGSMPGGMPGGQMPDGPMPDIDISAFEAKLKKILTEEQFSKWEVMQMAEMEKMRNDKNHRDVKNGRPEPRRW